MRIWSCFATIPDPVTEHDRLKRTVGRLATYLQGYGDLMVSTNDWDPTVLERFRADEVVAAVPGGIDAVATPEQLAHIATLFPASWLQAMATGDGPSCARAVRDQFDLGVDGVIMHGATPPQLEPVVAAYRELEWPSGAESLDANPGR